ncbi:MAG TPA: hypothetical protein VJI33_03660 [Candidatus Paceibacterota bacterium]
MKYKKINQVVEYFMHPNNRLLFGAEIMRSMDDFNGSAPITEPSMSHFLDWFLFDFKLFQSETPIAYFCRTNPLNFSAEQIKIFEEMRDSSVFDFFSVFSNDKNNQVVLEAIHGGDRFVVKGDAAAIFPKKGGFVVCRLLKGDGVYEIGSLDPICVDKASRQDIKRMKELSEVNSRVVNEEIVKKQKLEMPEVFKNGKIESLDKGISLISQSRGDVPFEEYDDCPVCQLMKKAEKENRKPSKEELMKAMEEANRQKGKQ